MITVRLTTNRNWLASSDQSRGGLAPRSEIFSDRDDAIEWSRRVAGPDEEIVADVEGVIGGRETLAAG